MYVRIFVVVLFLNFYKCQNDNEFLGTAELVKQSPRRSRLLSNFVDGKSETLTSEAPKTVSNTAIYEDNPVEEVTKTFKSSEGTIKNYGKIFQMDTQNLTDKQRVLLERIVERVARLGGNIEQEKTEDSENLNESRARARHRNVRKNNGKTENISTTKTIKRTTAGVMVHPTKSVSSSTTKVGKSKVTLSNTVHQLKPNATEVVFGNITTSSIVDSLSAKDTNNNNNIAREEVYARRPPSEKAGVKVSNPNTKSFNSLCLLNFDIFQ